MFFLGGGILHSFPQCRVTCYCFGSGPIGCLSTVESNSVGVLFFVSYFPVCDMHVAFLAAT